MAIKSADDYIEQYYIENGKCCAGCDWWRWLNSRVGECIKNAPVSSTERHSMLGIENCSLEQGAGHILTERSHVCGDFIDTSND